jgi:signal transduction histidine kinase
MAAHAPIGLAGAASELLRDREPAGIAAAEPGLESRLLDLDPSDEYRLTRWMGWRLRMLVGAALLGCLAFFLVVRWLGNAPHVDAQWRATEGNRIELAASSDAALHGAIGKTLVGVADVSGRVLAVDALALQRSSRWLVFDADRERHRVLHERLSEVTARGPVTLLFDDGTRIQPPSQRRGPASLGGLFWLLGAFALVLYLVAMVVLFARPTGRNLLYTLMALCQTGNLVFIAIESTLELSLPMPIPRLDMPARTAFDLVTAAAIVTAMCLHPRRLPGARMIGAAAWLTTLALIGLDWVGHLPSPWWWTQGAVLLMGFTSIGLLTWSLRIEPHPFAMALRRFGIVTMGSLLLLTAAVVAASSVPGLQHSIASIGSMIWYVFFASLLLLVPFLSKSRQIMREFSLLAAISTVATSLDLLFVAVFSLGQFASLTLSLFVSLGVYAGARQWLLNQLLGSSMLTTERMFEQLYRIAREVEAHPERTSTLLSHLVRDLFEPMEVLLLRRSTPASRVVYAGSTLVLPVPQLGGESGELEAEPDMSIVLRFAHRGRRLFTSEDARLADRIIEQLRRAVAFDKAVEQGRSEERARLAQDLHDDIGARLLTLMYKAPSAEMEEYVRHTLKDLKTLTRGLAAPHHRLSHAAAEWKADLSQRLTVAHVELVWNFAFDDDLLLSVVQWSALTRVLRELISNTIAHSQARRVQIDFSLKRERLELSVADDGTGHNPRAWSHGLGLGGVRKRVKQLGGEVEWLEGRDAGIVCRVTLPVFRSER